MKMEIPVTAPRAGTVKTMLVAEGQQVAEGQPLAVCNSDRGPVRGNRRTSLQEARMLERLKRTQDSFADEADASRRRAPPAIP